MTAIVFADLVGSTGIYERLGDETASRFVTGFSQSIRSIFESHGGRIVKELGDGVFVIFEFETQALAACSALLNRLQEAPIRPKAEMRPVQVRMGLETGEVVDIGGDFFGDVVNTAARLADLAGPDQILTTQHVHDALSAADRRRLLPLGPIYLRGKSDACEVYRVQWQSEGDTDRTMLGQSFARPPMPNQLVLTVGAERWKLAPNDEPLTIGRAVTNIMPVSDGRVSRLHAMVQWQGDQFVLSDVSSFGTSVFFGDQSEPVVLRRNHCFLSGNGRILLGVGASSDDGYMIAFCVNTVHDEP